MPLYPVELETVRLNTRPLMAEDAPYLISFFSDPEITAFIPTFGLDDPAARASYWIERQLTRYHTERLGLMALVRKHDQAFIGQCGLLVQEVNGAKEIEVGYHILKPFWGQGYAPEAAKCMIDYAFTTLQCASVISIIHIDNVKSQRVAEKNHLIKESQTRWQGLNVFIYRITNALG